MTTTAGDDILLRRDGRAGRITLNRPKALNALTYGMIQALWDTLRAWQSDPGIDVILLEGTGERALCAGGDVRSLYDSRVDGPGFARTFWRDEYRLNALISRYPKPYVAIQDGIVMGGGIGLSSHASHRIVTERSTLAMPETAIGLIPDVGGTWLLARAPGASGIYLGLTGETMKASDAIYAGFSDVLVPGERLEALKQRLCDTRGGDVDGIIAEAKIAPGKGALETNADSIAAGFSASTVEGIEAALARMPGEWAEKARKVLATKSPKALKLTLAAIERARMLPSLEAALDGEYRLVTRLFEDGEFPEGVRALIVDKDRAPKWRPDTLAGVTAELVARYLGPLPAGEELGLRNRLAAPSPFAPCAGQPIAAERRVRAQPQTPTCKGL